MASIGPYLKRRPLLRHLTYTIAGAAVLSALYALVYSKPGNVVWIEAEAFSYDRAEWSSMEDINFSGYRGIMTVSPGTPATASFDARSPGEYCVWVKYFGNYSGVDLPYWRSVYTNSFGYIDYNGAASPESLLVSVDGMPPATVLQKGSHRYRWARAGCFDLKEGGHVIGFSKAEPENAGPGSVNLDAVLVTPDRSFSPGRAEALPRQISEYLSPILIVLFPVIAWAAVRRKTGFGGPGVYLMYSSIIGLVLSILWIDTDGAFWIWLTGNSGFTPGGIYSSGDALHHRYVYPPPVALMLIALRPVLNLFGAGTGITPASLILSKLAVIPFALAAGYMLYRLEGEAAAVLWSLNSLVLFSVAANSMYFGLAFVLTLALYLIKKERHYSASLSVGLALAYMSAAMLAMPFFLLLLRDLPPKKAFVMAALALVPGFLIFLPWSLLDQSGMDSRVMGAGIATWVDMHLGLRLGKAGLTALLYGALLAWLWVRRPSFGYESVAAAFAAAPLIYLNIGAPSFLMWTVAFQPFAVAVAVRLRKEVFYAIYITALMVWGSFFQNTGGAGDRAGETGFFPNYVFYTWPFDVYWLVGKFYGGLTYFSRADLEAIAHSVSAGVSSIFLALIILNYFPPERRGVREFAG